MFELLLPALLGGLALALAGGPLGSLLLWQRQAFFSDTLAHSALLGLALSLAVSLPPIMGILLVCLLVAAWLGRQSAHALLPDDTLLSVTAQTLLALGLVLLPLTQPGQLNLSAYLFGDLLSLSMPEVAMLWGLGAIVLGLLRYLWRPLLLLALSEDLAAAEGHKPARLKRHVTLLLALYIAIAMKLAGALLIGALLILPAASARLLAKSPTGMARLASLWAAIALIGGLLASAAWNLPVGPAVVLTAGLSFFLTHLLLPFIRSSGEVRTRGYI